jgi:hypothetical protein
MLAIFLKEKCTCLKRWMQLEIGSVEGYFEVYWFALFVVELEGVGGVIVVELELLLERDCEEQDCQPNSHLIII